jgi:hypothetical protein
MPASPATAESSAALVRLVTALESSLPMYLATSGIQTYPGADAVRAALIRLVEEQKHIVGQAATVLDEREIAAPRPFYPLAYTALHDIQLRHLLPRLVAELRRQAEACDAIAVEAAGSDASATTLARDAAAVTRRHLGLLEELARGSDPVPAS